MLASNFEPVRQTSAGWFVSEKLDGMRAFWDGGISRGKPAQTIPWANTVKDSRDHIATGLWSRYGKVIHAPDYWLNHLPPYFLDGELWMGYGRFQDLMSTARSFNGLDWNSIKYYVFDSPQASTIFAPGSLDNGVRLGPNVWSNWLPANHFTGHFEHVYKQLDSLGSDVVEILEQEQLPFSTHEATKRLDDLLHEVCERGGEGLMIRNPSSYWEPCRSKQLCKIKKLHDTEATVIGYKWGEKTDKGSKLLGKMGSLRCRLASGVEFDLSGFTEDEREMVGEGFQEEFSGQYVDVSRFRNPNFPVGSRVTFTYRDFTNDGVPKEARYLRRRID